MSRGTAPGLNAALDELVQALEQTPALQGVRDGLAGYQAALLLLDPNHPAAAEAAALARVWAALTAVVDSVLTTREEHVRG